MGFGDLKGQAGLKALNEFLGDRSYIEGWVASQADIAVFEAVGKAPAAALAHALRWFNQISSYGSKKSSLPGVKKPVNTYGAADNAAAAEESDSDDDGDLFGSDTEEEKAIKAARVTAYKEKKSAKPALIAKSNVIFDVKPWDDETDMKEVERLVRTIVLDGLLWGSSTLVEIGYGIKKLRITTVIEDLKVSTEDLIEKICDGFEDHVQSVDIAAFNKI